MHSNFIPPISIEDFAAYLDGNLLPEDMDNVSAIIENDSAMQDIAFNFQAIDDTMTNNEPLEFMLPNELSSLDFEIPSIDNNIYNDDFYDIQKVADTLAMDETTGADDVDIDTYTNDDTSVLGHQNLSDYSTDNNDNNLINQDSVDLDDTPDYNDL